MNYPGIWKECKFCGMRYEQGTAKCPKCGSANARLVMPKEVEADRIFFAEEKVRKDKEQAEKQAKKKKSLRKWKKTLRILGIIAGIFLLICIVGSFLIGCWAMWMSQKDSEKAQEPTEIIESVESTEAEDRNTPISEEVMTDEEWVEWILPQLDKLFEAHADEEIVAIYKKAMKDNRPIYMWDRYMYGDVLYNHSYFEVLWAKEYAGEILTNYEIADLVNYYFLYWDFEKTYTYTDEEKARLQKYIDKLRDDVEWRLGRTDGELEALYEELTAEQGLDYGKVIEYVEDGNVWVASAIKATESMDDEAWMNKMFPVLDELYESGNDWELMLIYYNTKHQHKSSRPFEVWEHGHYVDYIWELMSMERLLRDVDDGKRLSELDYGTILKTYLKYADYADANIMTEEEMERFTPYFASLEQCATSLWDFSKGEWKALLEKSKTEYIGVEVERLIHKWLMEIDQAKQAEESEISE